MLWGWDGIHGGNWVFVWVKYTTYSQVVCCTLDSGYDWALSSMTVRFVLYMHTVQHVKTAHCINVSATTRDLAPLA